MQLAPPYNRLLMPVYLPSLLMALSQMALLILLPLYVLDLGFSPAFAATVVGLRGVGVLLFDVPAGMLVARFGDKPVLVGGLVLILLGNGLLAITANPLWLAFAAILLGAGFAAWMLGRQSYIADTCENHEVGRAIAVMAGLQRVGTFIGPAAGGLLAAQAGYPPAFAAGAAIAVIAAALVLGFTLSIKPEHDKENGGFAGTARLFRTHGRIFATAGLAALTLQLMRAARTLLIPLFGAVIGLDAAAVGLVYSASAAIDMCLFYPVGVLVDRRGRKWSAVPSMVLFAVGLALLPFAKDFYALLGVGLVLGIANGMGTGIVMIMGADLAQRTVQRGQFLGVWRLIGDVGMSVAPLLTGVLVNVASLAAASLSAAGIGVVGVAVMLFLVPETLRRPPSDTG
jgi:MFS family permease